MLKKPFIWLTGSTCCRRGPPAFGRGLMFRLLIPADCPARKRSNFASRYSASSASNWTSLRLKNKSATERDVGPTVRWLDNGQAFESQWRSFSGTPPPTRVVVADGRMKADEAYGLACQGTALLWRGDYQEARQ